MTKAEQPDEPLAEGTHVTFGRRFRTPAHPKVLMALGRAQYTFLSLEETVSAILYEAGMMTLPKARGKMAGEKEQALGNLSVKYRQASTGAGIADALDAAVLAFKEARQLARNKLSHAHPFTAGTDSEGNYLPGLGFTVKDGSSWETLASTPEDLLDFAAEVELAIDPLNAARKAVRQTPLSML